MTITTIYRAKKLYIRLPTASQRGQYLKNLMGSCFRKLVVLVLFFSSMPSSADVNIVIQGVEHGRGFIDVRIYLDAETWLKENQTAEHIVVPAAKGEVVVPLTTFQGGTLAAVVYHDENSDGKLNTGLFWQPKEGFAFSNQYSPKGPPQFPKAAVDITDGQDLIVQLKY